MRVAVVVGAVGAAALGACLAATGCAATRTAAPHAARASSAAGGDVRLALPPIPGTDDPAVQSVLAHVREASAATGLPVDLVLAVIWVESRFDPSATSSAGARGLMQLMPGTAAALASRLGLDGGDPYDPRFNVLAGAHYLAELLRTFSGDVDFALAAYNAGPARVGRWKRAGAAMPDYARRYVAAVLGARPRFGGPPAPPMIEVHDADALAALLGSAPAPESAPAPPESAPSP